MADRLPAPMLDLSAFAVAGFLARYREPTVSAYRRELRSFWQWCSDNGLRPLEARRPHIELYLRDQERAGYAPATIGRRLSTLSGLFRYAVIDELVPVNPTQAVARPQMRWEGQRRTVLHPLEFAAVLSQARRHGPDAHALVAMLGMIGLRVSEACAAQVADLRYSGGYVILAVVGKGAKPADIPLPIPVLRAVNEAVEGRGSGPILRSSRQTPLTRNSAARLLARLVRDAGVSAHASPHALRRTFCTAGLIAGVPLREMQYAMRHSDPRTTIRYDMARANLDRHAAHSVAAYLAGMAVN